jgi:hypothetical protein
MVHSLKVKLHKNRDASKTECAQLFGQLYMKKYFLDSFGEDQKIRNVGGISLHRWSLAKYNVFSLLAGTKR